ncbi:MAG: hypothetical protein HYZ33_04830, partial [Ignavibacteriales bacterium]|nr:hypothetical protein [Ignavibacteriales bacterium]
MKYLLIFSILLTLSTSFVSAQTKSAERTSVDLTIYNQNLSLIREERTMKLPKGTSRVVVPDIPETIDGTSVHFLSLTAPDAVKVLEQNYQYDLVNQGKLLEKYIGKEVEFVRLDEATKKEYTVKGIILSTGYQAQPMWGTNQINYSSVGGMVAEVNGKIEVSPAGRLVLPSLPEGLILKPQLEWLVANSKEGEHNTEISYLAGQLSWSCNYVVLLNKEDTKLDLTGWVTLTNSSGTTFNNAGLKLVAGDVNIVREQFNKGMVSAMRMETMDAAEPQFKQTDLFEYKLYSLQRRTDLKDNETKQIELTSGKNVASKKVFIYDGMSNEWRYYRNNYSYRSQGSFGQQSNPKVGVFVTFKNEKESGLGIALPKGKVRVYKRDDDGKEQFIGEDEIDHTPKDEELRLYLGNAFDIVGERVQKDFKSFSNGRVVEETIELKVRNHKSEPVEVLVYEHPWRWSEWEITKSNTEWQKVDQSTLKFPVKIAKDGEK